MHARGAPVVPMKEYVKWGKKWLFGTQERAFAER